MSQNTCFYAHIPSSSLYINSMGYIADIIPILQMRKQGDRKTKEIGEPTKISVIEI